MSPARSRDLFLAARWKAMVAAVETLRSRLPEGPFGFLQRWRRSLAQYRGIRYWLLVQGPIVLLGLGALFMINGFAIGWRNAYDVTVQITSPWADEVVQPWFAVPLSLAGWLVWPSVTGAVVGLVLADPTNGRGRSGSSIIPRLDSDNGDIPEPFVRYFEELHRGHRKRARSHWVQIAGRFLATDVVSPNADSQRKIDQAVTAAVVFLNGMPDKRCPICPRSGAHRKDLA